jgi:branched-chain amino acid aminotransferase
MAITPFDDRDGFIWFDGKLIPWRDARVHILTHALHYASSVFEGERVYNGKVFKLTEHSQRLIDSGAMLGMQIPLSVEELNEATRQTILANGITDGYVRPVAWRGSEMMGVAAQATKIHVAFAVWQWPSYFTPEARMRGIRLQISDWRRPHPQTAPTAAKAAGLYMICTMSKHKAENEGFEDALMLDWRGQVAEATGANIFFVIEGGIHTPTPDCFLDGITRQTVIALAKARGYPLIERAIQPEEMAQATECFLTGTAAEVTPVREIGPYHFSPGEITQTLLADYEALVRA